MKKIAFRAIGLAVGKTVRGRVARIILVVGLLPLLGIGAYLALSLRDTLGGTANHSLKNYSLVEAAAVANVVRQAEANIKLLASNPVLESSAATREEKRTQLLEAEEFFAAFEDITLIDPSGRVIDSTTWVFEGSWLANAAFQQALAGQSGMSEARVARSPARLVVEFAAPVGQRNQVAAVVVGRMNMERVWEILDPVAIGESGFLAAFDRHGNLLAYPDKGLLLTRLDGYPDAAASAGLTSLDVRSPDGDRLVGELAPVGFLGWQVAALQERSEAYAIANDIVQKIGILAAVVLILTVFASILFSRAVTQPIRTLSAGMHKIAEGSLDQRVPPAGLKEIDGLSAAFNSMAVNLEARTAEQTRAEEQIKYLAYHDPLTGLPNRALLKDRLTVALAQARRKRGMLAVMFVDLDRFKLVNDTVGHAMGDQLLRKFAERLTRVAREGDSLARVGGDEFTVLLPEISVSEDADLVAQRILEASRAPVLLAGHEFSVTASIGIAVYPGHGEDAVALLRNADAAMYRAKEEGRNTFKIFEPVMNARLLARVALEEDLRHALERAEFQLHYQPQVEIQTGTIVGVEALLRWQHPERGSVPPDEFISLAEETGLIIPIGQWVLRTACAQSKAWQNAGLAPMSMAVNLSPRQFQEPGLIRGIARVLQETGLPAQLLELEITESTAMRDVEFTIAMVEELRAMGVRVSIDDFGTGYSSLGYLKRLPVDSVKIDRSFVNDVTADGDDAAIVAAIVGLAQTMNLNTIAEGVETEEQLAFLKNLNCDFVQGFLFSKAVPAETFAKMLAEQRQLQPLETGVGPAPAAQTAGAL
ncbi:MAG: EAL domain-containing protein [Chloroflexi bacterium]|nr:EAL domain-containing protein [Chloroflexota bacterium]